MEFNNYSRNANEKSKALDKIKEERLKRQRAEQEGKQVKTLQIWWRKISSYHKYIASIYQDLEKKFKDIDTLVAYLSTKNNTKFTLPLNIQCQMITNLSIYYNYYAKRLMTRKSYFAKYKKKDQETIDKLKRALTLFEKLVQYSTSAIENPKNLENIYFYVVVEEVSIEKPKLGLKVYSLANFKALLRMSILTVELMHSVSDVYQTSTLTKTLAFLHLILDPKAHLVFQEPTPDNPLNDTKTSFVALYDMIIRLSDEFEVKKPLRNRPQIKKAIIQIFSQVLHRAISIRKEDSPDEQIIQVIQIIAYFANMYTSVGALKDRKDNERNYDFFLKIQSDFFVYLLSIPRFARFMKPIHDESIIKKLPKKYTQNLDVFQPRFWKDIFQAFLFNTFPNPYIPVIEMAETFKKKYESTTQIYFTFGNVIEIFHYLIKDLTVWEYFSTVKILSLCCYFITTSWLASIINCFEVDRDYYCLKDQLQKLFATQFVQTLFFKVFEIDEDSKGEEEKIDKGHKGVSCPIDLNSHIHFDIIELYAKLLAICQPSDDLQFLITSFSNAMAFNRTFVRKLYKVFKALFMDSINNKKDHFYFELSQQMYCLLDIFVTLYYNFLLITDSEDFVNQNHFSLAEVTNIAYTILKLSVNLNWNLDIIKEHKTKIYFAYQSAKLMKLIQEYNLNLHFIDTKKATIDKNWVKQLRGEIGGGHNQLKVLYLKRLPFTIPFESRLAIFQDHLRAEKEINMAITKITIRRSNLFEDGFIAFSKLGNNFLRGKLQVTFVDEFGTFEEGIDAAKHLCLRGNNGFPTLFLKFQRENLEVSIMIYSVHKGLIELSKIIFNPGYGLFKITENEQGLYPNPESESYLGSDHLDIFYFVGLVVGRAIYDNILIESEFSQFFLRKILGKINYINELQFLDKEMFNNVKFLKNYEGEVADLFLTFSVTDYLNKEVELIPNGKQLPVTNENKFKYIYAVANHKLHTEIKAQSKAFISGLSIFVTSDWLQIFNEEELQIVISGAKKKFDVDDLKSHTIYKGYMGFDGTVRDFWKVFGEFTEEEKILLLKFVTSCSRPPLLGFSYLNPQFTIQHVENPDGEKLPTASTCFNVLKLPRYSNKNKMKEKLLLAIKSGTGFNLA